VSIHVDQWFSQMVNIFAFAADRENCTGCICKSGPVRMFHVKRTAVQSHETYPLTPPEYLMSLSKK
jgi:hypothetical protein